MIIATVKTQNNGKSYFVNSTTSYPAEALPQEVADWLLANTPEPELTQGELDAQAIAAKWKLVDDYMATLEVTSDVSVGGNKFKADAIGIRNIESATHGMISTSTKYWVEDWGSFTTEVTELEWVQKEAQRLKEAKIVEVGL